MPVERVCWFVCGNTKVFHFQIFPEATTMFRSISKESKVNNRFWCELLQPQCSYSKKPICERSRITVNAENQVHTDFSASSYWSSPRGQQHPACSVFCLCQTHEPAPLIPSRLHNLKELQGSALCLWSHLVQCMIYGRQGTASWRDGISACVCFLHNLTYPYMCVQLGQERLK